jgi:hypothetical protein
MPMVKRNLPAPVESVPGEVVELARAVVAAHYEGELEAFDDILIDYQADPDGTIRGVRLDAPVGIGVDLAAMTPYVLSAATFVGGVLAEKLTDSVHDSTRQWLSRAWSRRRASESAEPIPHPDDTEAERVTVMITVHLSGLGAGEQSAQQVARSMVGELVAGGRPADERFE